MSHGVLASRHFGLAVLLPYLHRAVVLIGARVTGLVMTELEWLPNGRGVDYTFHLKLPNCCHHKLRLERDNARLLSL